MEHYTRTDPNKGYVNGWKPEVGPDGVRRRVKKPREPCRCGCGRMPPQGRRTFFGDDCVHRWKIRTDPGYVREEVYRRDHGVCGSCGLDTDLVRQAVNELIRERDCYGSFHHVAGYGFSSIGRSWLTEHGLSSRRSLWEAHHQVAVVEGGGLCGLEKYVTMCRWCHKRETAELAKRRAKKRKEERDAATNPV